MLVRLKPAELRPGMFVVSYGSGAFEDPVVKVERLILSADLAHYVSLASDEILVDTDRSVPVSELSTEERREILAASPLAALRDELPVAARLHAQAVALARRFMTDARAGRTLRLDEVRPLVEDMAGSMDRNETASVTARLRRLDDYTVCHCADVAVFCLLLGRVLGFSGEELVGLGMAGLLHDIGKARVSEAVLNKPGRLDEDELAQARAHALEGYLLLKDRPEIPAGVARAVLEHHERTDGRGYPYHLAGPDISMPAQIVSVADVYDALISETPYRRALPPSEALGRLYQRRGQGFCPECVEMLVRTLGVYPVGSFVRLTSGEYGVVAEGNPGRPLLPKVRVVFDARMRPRRSRVLDLGAQDPGRPDAVGVLECLDPARYKIDAARFLL
ncbi:HD-GYP domain-containing protein [Desulfovibrio aminophilus]|nr:HD-GYP domain-containing protein [Desulfovibrio aminophilus]MCM0754111.1 HD-GYP domain-containing protein [Desulfovibrio aminophilus]